MTVLLAQAVEILEFLELDQATSYEERCRRDHAIGSEQRAREPLARVLDWWEQVAPGASHVGARVAAVRRVLGVGLTGLGVVCGGSLCSVALGYQGAQPVNLMTLLGVVVGLPALLLLVTLAAAVLRATGWGPLRPTLEALRFNRWLLGLWRHLSSGDFLPASFATRHDRSGFVHWQLLVFSQYFAVGFYVGVAAVFCIMIATRDLAFGWSTTLQIEAETIRAWAAAIAAPWAQWWPAASPTAELVEASRFFRLETSVASDRAELMGYWWPFVLMTFLFWGMLPRLVLLGLGAWRLSRATRSVLLGHAQVTALLDRLAAPVVAFAGEPGAARVAAAGAPQAVGLARAADAAVLTWNDAPAVPGLADPVRETIGLGTLQSIAEQRESIRRIGAGAARLVVLTKGWEPPVLEFNDLLGLIRAELGSGVSILVAPVGVGGEGVDAGDLEIWSRAIAAIGDSHIYVADLARTAP